MKVYSTQSDNWWELIFADLIEFANDFLVPIIYCVNIIFALTVVFIERKSPNATIAWLMALFLLPVIGFILSLFVGQSFHRDGLFRIKKEDDTVMTG